MIGAGPLTVLGTTAGVAVLNAFWIVVPFDACTTARRACPRSAPLTVYELRVARGIAAHERPLGLHRSHR
jgi:hypothetical protein